MKRTMLSTMVAITMLLNQINISPVFAEESPDNSDENIIEIVEDESKDEAEEVLITEESSEEEFEESVISESEIITDEEQGIENLEMEDSIPNEDISEIEIQEHAEVSETGSEEERSYEGTAFAALVVFNGSLIFYRSNDYNGYSDLFGNVYNTDTSYNFADNIESRIDDKRPRWLWSANYKDVRTVRVADGQAIKPVKTDFYYWFNGLSNLYSADLRGFDTSEVSSFNQLFSSCNNLTTVNMSGLKTAKVTDMYRLFGGCSKLDSIDLKGIDTANVTDFGEMFSYCENLGSLDISSFDTSKATSMRSMFSGCKKLTKITLGEKFTKWLDNAYLPAGTWVKQGTSISKNEKELYAEYPSHATDWAGTWYWIDGVRVSGISLSDHNLFMNPQDKYTLTASIAPSDAAIQSVTWTSSDPEVVSVENGVLTANNLGTAVITATSDDGGFTETCDVSVVEKKSIQLSSSIIYVGETKQLISILPEHVSQEIRIIELKPTDHITISTTGEVTGISRGKTQFKIETDDGTASCSGTIYALDPEVAKNTKWLHEYIKNNYQQKSGNNYYGIYLDDGTLTSYGVNLRFYVINQNYTIGVYYDTYMQELTSAECIIRTSGDNWFKLVTNPDIMTINPKSDLTGTVTSSLSMTASEKESFRKRLSELLLLQMRKWDIDLRSKTGLNLRDIGFASWYDEDLPYVDAVELDCHSMVLHSGQTGYLNETVYPENKDIIRTVTWESSDPNVVSVDELGILTGVSPGTAVVTVITDESRKKDECEVTVISEGHAAEHVLYQWSDDFSEVTALCTCDLCGEIVTEKVNTHKEELVKYTCTETGLIRYTAEFVEPVFETQTKDVEIPAGHKYVLDHWEPDNSFSNVTAVFICSECGETERVSAPITKSGSTYYAEVTFEGNIYQYSKVVSLVLSEIHRILPAGNGFRLTASSMNNETVTWSSDNTNVATVTSTGFVSAHRVGSAVITATTPSGLSANCKVNVLFKDVADPERYYFDPVYWAFERNITTGTSPDMFSPDQNVTRGQIVSFLYRTAGEPYVSGYMPFRDVARGRYFYDAILWASQNGITTGTSPTTFNPDSYCTRAQIVTFLWRYMGEPNVGYTNRFTDVRSNSYYAKAVAWAAQNGITTGTSPTLFSPDRNCTRAQAVSFLYRAIGDGSSSTGYKEYFEIDKDELNLKQGDAEKISAYYGRLLSDNQVKWSSDNSAVATVDDRGNVVAKASGEAVITAEYNGMICHCYVYVTIKTTGITLNKTSLDMTVEDTAALVATVTPADASDKSVTWSTSNSNVATVSNGRVTAVGAGTAYIVAETNDTGLRATCTVTVREKPAAVKNNMILIDFIKENGQKGAHAYRYSKDLTGDFKAWVVTMEYYFEDDRIILIARNKTRTEDLSIKYLPATLKGTALEVTSDPVVTYSSGLQMPYTVTGSCGAYDMQNLNSKTILTFDELKYNAELISEANVISDLRTMYKLGYLMIDTILYQETKLYMSDLGFKAE